MKRDPNPTIAPDYAAIAVRFRTEESAP